MKKFLSVFLVLVLTLSFASVSLAADESSNVPIVTVNDQVDPTVPEVPGETEEPEEPEEPEVPSIYDYEFVATMYLCANALAFPGHVWLVFENLTECEIPLGYVTLNPHEVMSVGSLGNTRYDGGGTYYNGETMMAQGKLDRVCKNTVSLKMNLTMKQLEKVNSKIKSLNAYQFIFWNCGCFATQVWNCVSSKKVVHIVLPVFTVLNMYILGAKNGQIRMPETTIDRAFKQKRDCAVPANEKSFRRSCVG